MADATANPFPPPRTDAPRDHAYIAALWEHPDLCLAFFGAQFHTEEGQREYEAAGITEEMMGSLAAAGPEGLLLNRAVMSPEGPLLLQYWRSYEDLDRWSRKMPHTRWWAWLLDHAGKDMSFYHEIYRVKTGEAIYEVGCNPVGPALFSSLETVKSGEGRSKDRQRRFAEAASQDKAGEGNEGRL
jgi:hypothetical protein